MSMVLKVVAIVVAVVLVIGILGTVIGVGVNLVRYMVNQNFSFENAFNWSWSEFTSWLTTVNLFKAAADEYIPMANKCVNIVPCIDL